MLAKSEPRHLVVSAAPLGKPGPISLNYALKRRRGGAAAVDCFIKITEPNARWSKAAAAVAVNK